MSQSPNRRIPCGQSTITPYAWFGGCSNNSDSRSLGAIPRKNITLMEDYASGSYYNPSGIPVYAWASQAGAPDCSDYAPGTTTPYECGNTASLGNGNIPCGVPPPKAVKVLSGKGTQSLYIGKGYYNYYVTTSNTPVDQKCINIGWKGVLSRKSWHGRHSYTSNVWGLPTVNFDWCCQCGYQPEQETVDDTRYLGQNASYDGTFVTTHFTLASYEESSGTCPDTTPWTNTCYTATENSEFTRTTTANNSVIVDKFGNLKVNTCNSSSTSTDPNYDTEYFDAFNAFSKLGEVDSNAGELGKIWCNFLDAAGDPTTATGTYDNWTLTWEDTYNDCDVQCVGNSTFTYTKIELTITLNGDGGGTVHLKEWAPVVHRDICTYGCNYTVTQTLDEVWTYGATGYTHTINSFYRCSSREVEGTGDETIQGSLNTTYKSDDVYAEMTKLLGYYAMDNDSIYPWRTDDYKTKIPFVTYDESWGTAPHVTCEDDNQYSGEVLGKPAPAGTDAVWCFWHPNYCTCCDDGNGDADKCCFAYINTYGAWSTDINVPCATQWTDDYIANNIPDEAFVGNGLTYTWKGTCNSGEDSRNTDDGFWGAKYAEIVFNKHSFNYARPCGKDRFEISSSSARCIKTITDLTIETDASTDFNDGDYVWVCGTDTIDGCWTITKNSDTNYTLDTLLISASLVPSASWQDCGAGMVGRIRYQSPSGLIPPICGRIDIISASLSSPITCSLADDSYLVDGDNVIIQDAKGGDINGYWEVKVIGSREVALVDSDGIVPYTGSGTIRSPFAADWKWNDTSTKGDYTTIQWNYNYRDIGEYNRLTDLVPTIEAQFQCDPPGDPFSGTPCPSPTVPPEPRPYSCYSKEFTEVSCSTACLTYNPCSPVVAYFAPTGSEDFKQSGSVIRSARNHGWGKTTYDTTYGSLWQGIVKQDMPDPYWEKQPCGCEVVDGVISYPCSCKEDDGTCQEDQAGDPELSIPCYKYQPHRPMFEARCEVPEGAPPLSPGYHIGCVKVDEGCIDGNYCYPPSFGDAQYIPSEAYLKLSAWETSCPAYPEDDKAKKFLKPWDLYLKECACIEADGRFATEYSENLIGCTTDYFPAP